MQLFLTQDKISAMSMSQQSQNTDIKQINKPKAFMMEDRESPNDLNTLYNSGQLNYSDHITELHRQYLASIAPLNILFRTVANTTNDTAETFRTISTSPSLSTYNGAVQNSYEINEGCFGNEEDINTVPNVSTKNVIDKHHHTFLNSNEFWQKSALEIVGGRRYKSDVMFSIENIMKKT